MLNCIKVMEERKVDVTHPDDLVKSLQNEIAALESEIRQLKASAKSDGIDAKIQADYQESQNRFRTVFESSRLGNKIISSNLKIQQVNSAMVSLLGYNCKEDLIGTKIIDYSPADHKKHWQILQEKLWKKATPSFSIETTLMKKDGSVIWCQVTSILFKDKGETLGYTIIDDITEKHQLRLQKDEFISVASHELKTPLTSLKGVLQLLNRKINGEAVITDKHISLAQNAITYTEKLTNLVADLLNSTKIEQGQLTLNKSIFKLSDVLDECCNHIVLEGKYYLSLHGNLSLEVFADQQKIEQVLVNLVNNSVKYAPESVEIVVRIEDLADRVKVSVIDRGKGIPAENIPNLFDRYYRVNNNGNEKSGLGLGLYISAEIIRRHGGEMGVVSEPEQGSTFWFTIPKPV